MAHETLFGRPQISLSFAGENRVRVKEIAEVLRNRLGDRQVFFDEWFKTALVGADADQKLRFVYGQASEMVVVFVSESYVRKSWTGIEHREIRAFESQLEGPVEKLRIFPVRLDRGPMPRRDEVDLLPTNTIYHDATDEGAEETADVLLERLKLYREAKVQIDDNVAAEAKRSTAYFISDCPNDPRCIEARNRIITNLTAHRFVVWPPTGWRYYSDKDLAEKVRNHELPSHVTLVQITLSPSAASAIPGGPEALAKQEEERQQAAEEEIPWNVRCWDASGDTDASLFAIDSPGEPTGLNDFEKSLLKPPAPMPTGFPLPANDRRLLQVWFVAGDNQVNHSGYKTIESIQAKLDKYRDHAEFGTITYDELCADSLPSGRIAAIVHVRGTEELADVNPHRQLVLKAVRSSLPLVCEKQDILYAIAQLPTPANMPRVEINMGGLKNFSLTTQEKNLFKAILKTIRKPRP